MNEGGERHRIAISGVGSSMKEWEGKIVLCPGGRQGKGGGDADEKLISEK